MITLINLTEIFLAYLMSGDFNVIVIDWGTKSKQTYRFARMSVPEIAKNVVQMIDFLRRQGMGIAKGVGLSLGAHLLGIAGNDLTKKLDYLVGELSKPQKIHSEKNDFSNFTFSTKI